MEGSAGGCRTHVKIGVVTVLPQMFEVLRGHGVTGRALHDGRVDLSLWNPRDLATDRHRSVDDRPYGGGPGMVMRVEPTRAALRAARAALGGTARVVCLSPQGRRLDQAALQGLSVEPALLLLCGRYEGIDERLLMLEVDDELSLGDFVISGGELAAMVVIDGIVRLLPGVLGHARSAVEDSFVDGLLDCPHFTRPERVEGLDVPAVLLSGHHGDIARWRHKQALGRTHERRPDLLEARGLSASERELLDEYLAERSLAGAIEQDPTD